MTSLPATCLLSLRLEFAARRLHPPAQHAVRLLRWSYSSVSAPFSLADPHDDPSLRALYEPYPSAPPDNNLFEDGTSNQTLNTHKHHILRRNITVPSQLPHAARSNSLLLRCIREDDYTGAISLRRDLNALHTPIAPNAAYARVAQHLLNNPDQSNPHAFLGWCELVPNLRDPWSKSVKMPTSMIDIFTRLLQTPEDIDTICRFTTLAAYKGMARWVAIPAIGHVTRYSTPEVASKLLSDLTNAAAESASRSHASTIPPKVMRSWNSTFIRALCLSGRIDAAHQSLIVLHSNQRTVAPSAYRIVAEELELLGRLGEANRLRVLCEKAGFSRPHFPVRPPSQLKAMSMPWRTISSQLRWIKLRIDLRLSISARDLVTFIRSYLSTGHRRALPLLRKRLLRQSDNTRWKYNMGLWGTAEMQLYRSEGKHDEVLRVFQSIFLPVGVTNQLLNELGVLRPSAVSPSRENPPSLWPPSQALTLATSSAASLAVSREDHGMLDRCYSIFLGACRPTSSNLFRLPPAMAPDAATFQPWVGAFARRSGPEGVIRVMGDMRELRISPSIMTWNTLAKAYVTNNEWDIAKSILTKMEASRDQSTSSDASSPAKVRLRNRLGPLADWGFPAANTSTYYVLLRELWMTKQISAAREFGEMLMRNGYRSDDKRIQSFLQAMTRKNIPAPQYKSYQ
jgi:hypothetical protein